MTFKKDEKGKVTSTADYDNTRQYRKRKHELSDQDAQQKIDEYFNLQLKDGWYFEDEE